MSSSARKVVVEFLGEDHGLSHTTSAVDSKTSKLGATFKTVGKAAALGLAAGAVAAGAALVGMAKNAAEDDAAHRKLAIALKNSVGATDAQIASVEDYISKTGIATGVTDDEMRPALQRLVQSTGSITEAQKQMGIALDVSAGTGKSLKTVTEAMMKANNGTTASLSRLGLKTKDAQGNTLSLKDAMASMADTFKGQAASQADSVQGKMARLQLIFDETKETIGYKVIPVLIKLADFMINDVVPALQAFGRWFGEEIQPKLTEFAAIVKKYFAVAVAYVRDHMDQIKQTISDVVDVVKALWARFGSSILSIAASKLKLLWATIKGAFQIIKGIFEVFSGILHGDWSKVWQGIKDILKGVLGILVALIKDSWNTIKVLFKAAGGVLKDLVRGIWDGIKNVFTDGIGWLITSVVALPGKIIHAAGHLFAAAGKALIGLFIDGLKNAAGLVADIAGNIWDAVKTLLNDAIDKINSALSFTINLPFGKHVTIDPPDIPHLAKGGIVTSPTFALIGESGPEAVIPLGRGGAPSVSGGGGGVTVNVYGALDPNAVAKQIEEILTRRKRLTGSLAFT